MNVRQLKEILNNLPEACDEKEIDVLISAEEHIYAPAEHIGLRKISYIDHKQECRTGGRIENSLRIVC